MTDDPSGPQAELSQLRRLELASALEATTLLLLLFVAVPLKHFGGYANAVHVMGPVHGMAFLVYAWMAIQTVSGGGWSGTESARLMAGALVPFGGFLNLWFLARKAAPLR